MTTDQWAAVVGFILPALVAVINREPWAPWIKALVALASSVLGGTVTALLAGAFTGSTWIQAIGIVFASSQIFYQLWWKGSQISDWIEQNVFGGGGPKPLAGRHAAQEDFSLGGKPGGSGGAITSDEEVVGR